MGADGMAEAPNTIDRTIAVIGLGYVGLPVAVSFARAGLNVIGFDIDAKRIDELVKGHDRTREIDPHDLHHSTLRFTADTSELTAADFFIVTVPTPIDAAKKPDLSALIKASETVGAALKIDDIVVYESTVYPGATEEDCIPVLEKTSGLKAGADFTVGYSPERINPGDKQHRFESIMKVVSGQDAQTLEEIARIYEAVVTAGVHRAPSIKVAEAAKVIENTQRDLNVALMNELSAIFSKLGVDTNDVLAAAATKWNFLPFTPGLVGGHCIGVDPYYLTYRAEKAGYHPEVILAGRRINDTMGARIVQNSIKLLVKRGIKTRKVTILGLTFKENVPDTRNTRVVNIAEEFEAFGFDVQLHDPVADPDEVREEYGLELNPLDRLGPADIVVLAVAHESYLAGGWELVTKLLDGGDGIVVDIKAILERATRPEGVQLWRP